MSKLSVARTLLCLGLLIAISGTLVQLPAERVVRAASAPIPPDQVAVKIKPGVNITTILNRYNATQIGLLTETNLYFLKLNGQPAGDLLPILNADPDLYYAEPNYYGDPPDGTVKYIDGHSSFLEGGVKYIDGHSNGTPVPGGDPYWAWNKTALADAQKVSKAKGIIVALLDTGLAADHTLLNSSLNGGYDFVSMKQQILDQGNGLDDDGDGKIDEQTGHGTHVAGIILTVAPEAQIMPVRVLNSDGVGTYWEVAAGIRYAVDHGAKVINMSLSAPLLPPSLLDALNYAAAHDVLVVAAAGEGPGPNYPAAFSNKWAVLGVGATDQNDQVAWFSGGAPADTDVYAPGVSIYSSFPYNGYVYASGTSMAAPFVAGEAALLFSKYPDWSALRVAQQIASKTAPVNNVAGRVNLAAAIDIGVEVHYRMGDPGSVYDSSIKPYLRLVSDTPADVPLSEFKIRYWYTVEGYQPQVLNCDYATIPCSSITGSFVYLPPSSPNYTNDANAYLEIGFTSGAGILTGGNKVDLFMRFNKYDWSSYNESNDYSYDPTKVTFAKSTKITVYRNDQLVWGIEPGGTSPTPSATPTSTATQASTLPAPTATRTPTLIAPTSTALPTATSTATPLPTATKTSTSVPTATKTSTPLPTATRTSTTAPTATRNSTPVQTPSSTAIATATPLSGYAINDGGSAAGAFAADAFFSGGSTSSTSASIDLSSVWNPAPMAVYQSDRWSMSAFTYTFSNLVPGRSYLVRMHFAENVFSAPNQRQFNVVINNMQLWTNLDIYAVAGAKDKAIVCEVSASASSNGQITVAFTKGQYDNPKVNGIEIIR